VHHTCGAPVSGNCSRTHARSCNYRAIQTCEPRAWQRRVWQVLRVLSCVRLFPPIEHMNVGGGELTSRPPRKLVLSARAGVRHEDKVFGKCGHRIERTLIVTCSGLRLLRVGRVASRLSILSTPRHFAFTTHHDEKCLPQMRRGQLGL